MRVNLLTGLASFAIAAIVSQIVVALLNAEISKPESGAAKLLWHLGYYPESSSDEVRRYLLVSGVAFFFTVVISLYVFSFFLY